MADTPTVLIVDDDPTTIVLLEAIFQQEGFRTLSADSGPAARATVAAHRPDLILLDVQMPGESGFEVCRLLQADPASSDIPVLFLSAEDDVASRVAGLEAGAVDYVTKPFSRAEVLARARTHIRLSRAYRSLVQVQAERLAQVASAQQAILPRPDRWPEARFAAVYEPLAVAGGDFYDVIPVGEQVFDYLVADVSGHDAGSALSTAALKALLHQNANVTDPPVRSLQTVNRVLRTVLPDGQFLTLVYARLNRAARRMTLVQAGHPPAIHVPVDGAATALEDSGDVLGAFEAVVLGHREVKVARGDRLYLFSDGLVEATEELAADHRLGLARLIAACDSHRRLPLADALDAIVSDAAAGGPPRDDVVLVGIEI